VSLLSWTFWQLVVFWLVAFGIAQLLWFIGSRLDPGPWKFFWLLPARNRMHALWLAIRAIVRVRPLQMTAIAVWPLTPIVVSAVWLAGRLVRHKG
jgi:hypothetical protein